MKKKLKIALSNEIKQGPWGGGNQFLISFKRYFEKKGAIVVHHLEEGLDLIILINPKRSSGTFNHVDIKKYKKKHPGTIVIHRINETDKAKNTSHINRIRLKANRIADAVVFISKWVRDYYIQKGFDSFFPHTVIQNGPDERIFNSRGYKLWKRGVPLRIVTHHWSNNWMKGFDIYKYFDDILQDPWMRKRFQFTIIGRHPDSLSFSYTKCLPPMSGMNLAHELKKNHVYLTAARWESCGMHQLEGALCGLPVLYIDESGGIVETCKGFGIQFTKKTFSVSLFKMLDQYRVIQPKMKNFSLTATNMVNQYGEFIGDLLKTI